MGAVQINKYNKNLKVVVKDIEIPKIREDEVLVKVRLCCNKSFRAIDHNKEREVNPRI